MVGMAGSETLGYLSHAFLLETVSYVFYRSSIVALSGYSTWVSEATQKSIHIPGWLKVCLLRWYMHVQHLGCGLCYLLYCWHQRSKLDSTLSTTMLLLCGRLLLHTGTMNAWTMGVFAVQIILRLTCETSLDFCLELIQPSLHM